MKHNPLSLLILALFLKAGVMVWVILYAGIGLGPDEAQYWTWSQALGWGYYSKPPAIAWQIWLGTQIFGSTELGVRFFSVVIAFLQPLVVYWLARSCRLSALTAFWAGMMMAFTPLGVMASLLAITDGGLVLFWTFACITVTSALSRNASPNFYLLGGIILCGALFKWPIYLFWIFIFFYSSRINRHLIGGICVSLLGLLPSVIWNVQNQWATFRHVFYTIVGGHAKEVGTTPLLHGNVVDFVGAQAALLSPILFVLLVLTFIVFVRNRKNFPLALHFCGTVSLAILVVYTLLSIFKKMQGNWCVFAYPTGIVLLSWYACRRAKKWMVAGLALSVMLCAFVLSVPYIQSETIFGIPYKMNPFRHNIGWGRLTQELEDVGYDPDTQFLFGDKYQMSSILSFYGPAQKRAYFFNLQGARKNQFSYWPGMIEEQKGNTGFFALAEDTLQLAGKMDAYQQLLGPYFGEVRFLGMRPLFYSNGNAMKSVLIFKCLDFKGEEPVDPEKY